METVGREAEEGGRRGAVGASGMRGTGGRWREGKEAAKETNQILHKNKSTMLDDLGCTEVNPDIFEAQESYICQSFANIFEKKICNSQLSSMDLTNRKSLIQSH